MQPVDQLYLGWLYDQVVPAGDASTYSQTLNILFTNEYVPRHPMDENRAIDGIGLRSEWLDAYDHTVYIPPNWVDEPCSILEMIVALSRRCEFQTTSISAQTWAMTLLNNMGVWFSDIELDDDIRRRVYHSIELFESGQTTIFPTDTQDYDQQLWYQMMEYIDVNNLIEFI